ncbi:cytochrome d ubiquinol oxidase subunit I [Chitinophaga terrae (ex Kim and Jung 2007)]|uniref:Cytochrome d ubiquinol oxidase subunit I n=1 Tax=Chitinophaga terrae (ex Kim and Jung 2007) TaxID=408074 RepID=A0A1H4CPR6_9BACT|nr:cytochrome ubiquinol oxidase subunit I [Chitinophaga terrae (ex Kim and Jung 2007)]MDQ0105184.1 cytochrome d ubiquinol oxidase subunit I [Chitinophaga terrae (ex Kim and Jung 2007)]GEP90374.1 cytochrome ubiquinol oxidase subunit I [Chitinophaga terrae (ex Kim and Jung 2007)]SEA62364.1 cytochrome d ubiquinol oxidase subunit I [Chitinophaga terrae (ex Kim and Jung 2007)]
MPSVEILSRIQFAFTIAFHYIYPPLSIGLGVCLVIMEGLYLKTGLLLYKDITRFWIKIFALIFGIGVATGIVMEFEFGTNWATYSHYVGDIFGSALAAEGIFAFAMESAFLGVLLFGWNKVNKGVHFFSTCMVALGSIFSALWIVIANSWQQTPAGFRIEGEGLKARAVVTDFWEMVLNPSSVDRFSHVIIGAFLAGSFLVISVGAWYILKERHIKHAQAMFKVGLSVAAVAALLQLFTGHRSAHYVSKYQPEKLAAMEGHYDSSAVAPMYIVGWVDNKAEKTTGIKIPGGLSFLTHNSFSAPVQGLNATPKEERPTAVNFVFQMYHIMISIGVALIALTIFGVVLLWKNKLFNKRWLMIIFCWSVLLPQIANQVGWYAAEVGRQPWVVYKLLKTSDALSKKVTADQVMFSLILFTFVYVVLFALFIYLLNRKIQHGPDISEHAESEYDGYYHDNITFHPTKL